MLAYDFDHDHRWRYHQPLEQDRPCPREVHPTGQGRIIEIAHLGSLHYHYEHAAA